MTEHYVRIGLCAVAILWAIARVHQTGNYTRIRLYLYALLADCVLLGLYGAKHAFSGFGYEMAYTASYTVLGVLAILAALGASKGIPRAVSAFVANAAVLASLWAWAGSDKSTVALLVIMQAGLFFMAGMNALAGSHKSQSAPMRTLAFLWLAQMAFLYLYAAGVSLHRTNWEAIGNWVPTAVVIGAFVKLGFDFKQEPHGQLQAQIQ